MCLMQKDGTRIINYWIHKPLSAAGGVETADVLNTDENGEVH